MGISVEYGIRNVQYFLRKKQKCYVCAFRLILADCITYIVGLT